MKRKNPEPKPGGGLPSTDHMVLNTIQSKKEVKGCSWYVDGNLDKEFINKIKEICEKIIQKQKVLTVDGVYDFVYHKIGIKDCTSQQISEILRCLVLDNKIMEVVSNGVEEYDSIPVGKLCYKIPAGGPKTGAMESIPCGTCPRIRECTPDGLISPTTCVYFTKWLDF